MIAPENVFVTCHRSVLGKKEKKRKKTVFCGLCSRMGLLYDFIVFLAQLSVPMFFSDVFVIGKKNIPKTGAIMIVG